MRAIEVGKTYLVDFANARFQVRTIRPVEHVPGLWECVSLSTGTQLVIPERAFLEELDGLVCEAEGHQ